MGNSSQLALARRIQRRGQSVTGDSVEEVTIVPVQTDKKLVTVNPGLWNPNFKAQIQVSILKSYYSVAAGVYTAVAPGAMPAALQQSLPFFMFANSDFSSGFAKLQGQFPLTNWTYQAPFIYNGTSWPGIAVTNYGLLSTVPAATLRKGDLVIPFSGSDAGTLYAALVVVRTNDVPYGTLLQATFRKKIKFNLIRYNVTLGEETQFGNQILLSNETMLGKFTSDPLNPEAFKSPEQDQNNIVDIDLVVEVTNEYGISSLINHAVTSFRWNMFITDIENYF